MVTTTDELTIIFPEGFDARSEIEMPVRGYLSGVVIELKDGSRYQAEFIDLARLGQNLDDDQEAGRPYFAEPGLIVLPEVTTESIQKAVQGLWKDGYFGHLKALQPPRRLIPEDEAIRQRIRSAFQEGDWQAVLNLLKEFHHLLPAAESSFYRGRCSTELGLVDTGLYFLEEAARLDPNNGNYPLAIVDTLLDVGRVEEAANRVGRIPAPHGIEDGFIGNPDRFIQVANRLLLATKLLPDSLTQPITAQVARMYELALGFDPSPGRQEQLSTLLAVCYEILGAEDQALLAYEKVIQLNPRNDAALVGRGLLRYTSDPEAAASDFTKAVATNTPLAWPYFYLAHRSLQIGDYRGTLDRCVQALKRANLSTVKADLFEWMAIAQSYLGVAPDSIRANFETALELAPSNERIRRNYKRFVAKLEQAMTPDWEKTYSVTPDEARRMAA